MNYLRFNQYQNKQNSWIDIDRILRRQNHEDIRALPAKVANAVLKNLGENITSYWGLVRRKRTGELSQQPKLNSFTTIQLLHLNLFLRNKMIHKD